MGNNAVTTEKVVNAKSATIYFNELKMYVLKVSSCGLINDLRNVGKKPSASIIVIRITDTNGPFVTNQKIIATNAPTRQNQSIKTIFVRPSIMPKIKMTKHTIAVIPFTHAPAPPPPAN